MHTIKITPNLLFEYQCTSGKFIRLPNRIEKIDLVARIESKLFCPNWNDLVGSTNTGIPETLHVLYILCYVLVYSMLFNIV